MSYHHTHCPACNKVLGIKHGMAERCSCPAAGEEPTVPHDELDRLRGENSRLRDENERLVERNTREALRTHGGAMRIAELEAQLGEAQRQARINADSKTAFDMMRPYFAKAQAYFEKCPRGRLGANYLDMAMCEIDYLNLEIQRFETDAKRLVTADSLTKAIHTAVQQTFAELKKG